MLEILALFRNLRVLKFPGSAYLLTAPDVSPAIIFKVNFLENYTSNEAQTKLKTLYKPPRSFSKPF